MFRNRRGHPADYIKRSRRELIGYVLVVLIAGAAAIFFSYRAIYQNGEILFAGTACAAFLFLLFVAYSATNSKAGIALYFEYEVAGDWVRSEAVLQNCVYLDRIANEAGLTPLSSFGFADDFRHEHIVWHDSKQGLQTVAAVLTNVHDSSYPMTEIDITAADLKKMEDRLQEACNSQTRFCFIFRHDAWNGAELEIRKGFF